MRFIIQDSPQRGIAEIHISKHRGGPIGKVELTFLEHKGRPPQIDVNLMPRHQATSYTKLANLARGM